MNEIETAAHQYIADKYPGRTFTNVMAVIMYLKEVKGIPSSQKDEAVKPQIYPDEKRSCPTCGGEMRKFALCTNCDLYKEHGYVAQWICLKSKGVLQKTHSNKLAEPGEVSYADFLAFAKVEVDTNNLTCDQMGILLKDEED